MTEDTFDTLFRTGYLTVEEGEENKWKARPQSVIESVRRTLIRRAMKEDRDTYILIDPALVRRARLGSFGWILLSQLHSLDRARFA